MISISKSKLKAILILILACSLTGTSIWYIGHSLPAPSRSSIITPGSMTKSCDVIVYKDGTQAIDVLGTTGDNSLVSGTDYAVINDAIMNTAVGGKLCFQGAGTYALGANTMTIPSGHFMYLDFAANVTISSSGVTTFKSNSPVIIMGDPTFRTQWAASNGIGVFFHNPFDITYGSTYAMLRVRGNTQNAVYIDGAAFDGTYILDIGDSVNDRFQNGLELVAQGGNQPNNNVFINYRCGLALGTYAPTGGLTACINIVNGSHNTFVNSDVGYGATYGYVLADQKNAFLEPHCESLTTCFQLNAGSTGTVAENPVYSGVSAQVIFNGGSIVFVPIFLSQYTVYGASFAYNTLQAATGLNATTVSTTYIATGLCVAVTPNFSGRIGIQEVAVGLGTAAAGVGFFAVYRVTGSCPAAGVGVTGTIVTVGVASGTLAQTVGGTDATSSGLTIGTTYQFYLAWKTTSGNTESLFATYGGASVTSLTAIEI